MKAIVGLGDVQYADVRGKPIVQRAQELFGRRIAALGARRNPESKMRHLSARVDAGVRASSALQLDRCAQVILGRLAKLAHHGSGVLLLLPATVLCAIVFEYQLPGFQFPSVLMSKSWHAMKMLKEFKAFVMRGNVLDLAVAVIIGAAFGRIVTSFVNDILMPPIGIVLGKVDFSNLFIDLSGANHPTIAAAKAAGAATINYGVFLNTIIDFLIVAFVIFLVVQQANRLKKPVPAAAPTTKDCTYCYTSIPLPATRCPNCTSQLA